MKYIKVEGVLIANVIVVFHVNISMVLGRIDEMYGKLDVIKHMGEKPLFVITHEDGTYTPISELSDWLFKRLGKIINVYICDKHFQITDVEEE